MPSVDDNDVQLYLDELKGFIFSFGSTTDTGTANLVVLLNLILDDIDKIKFITQDKLSILLKRYTFINSQLNTYANLYKENLIEERYLEYKTDNRVISVDSDFMHNVVKQLDLTMSTKIDNLSGVRYESSFLSVNINVLNDTLTNITSMKEDINALIQKCEAT